MIFIEPKLRLQLCRGKSNMSQNEEPKNDEQPRKPHPDLNNLELLVGKWNTEGEILETVNNPAGKFTATDVYEWLAGNFFLIHRAEAQMPNGKTSAIEIIGYDESKKTLQAQSFDNQGNADIFRANMRDRVWTLEGESARFTGEFGDDGQTLSGRWEFSTDGANWQPWMNIKLTKTV